MSLGLYRKWPLSSRRSRRLPGRVDLDDLLRRSPKELVEMAIGRLQEASREPAVFENPSRISDDLQLLGLVVVRLIDVLEQYPQLKRRLAVDRD